MKRIIAFTMLVSLGGVFSSQYMIVGKDSISLSDFKRDYLYGLENNGIEKTINSTEDFLLLQQYAEQKKADTMSYFRERMMEREKDLRAQYFYPKQIFDPILEDFVKDNQTEKQIQIFFVQKTEGDAINYRQIYEDVKNGKMTMEEAITKYTKGNPTPIYIKPGGIDNSLYTELKSLPNNSLTKLKETPNVFAFVKVLNSRPSLGYILFGTLSYPKDANSETIKSKIYGDLNAGKIFREVANL
jgi:peptidyl-prolyl cis-trans isomerase SurA